MLQGGHRHRTRSIGNSTLGRVHNGAPTAELSGSKRPTRTDKASKVEETDVEDFFCLGVPSPDLQHQVSHIPSIRGSSVLYSRYEPEESLYDDSSETTFDDVNSSQNERWERVSRHKIASKRHKRKGGSQSKSNLSSHSRSNLTYKNVSQHTERLKKKAANAGKVASTLPIAPHAYGSAHMHAGPNARGNSRMHAASVPYQYPDAGSRISAVSGIASFPKNCLTFGNSNKFSFTETESPSEIKLRKPDVTPAYVAPRLEKEARDTFDMTHTVPLLLTPPQPNASSADKKEFLKQQLDSFGLDQPIYETVYLLGSSSPYRSEGGMLFSRYGWYKFSFKDKFLLF